MSSDNDILTIPQGSTKDLVINLVDSEGNPESLSSADRASFVVKSSLSSSASLLIRDTSQGNLIIATNSLVASVSLEEAESLNPGTYLGQVSIRFGDDEEWYYSDFFKVRVLDSIAVRV